MTAREIYAAVFHGRERQDVGGWQFVGDVECFDETRFRAIVASAIHSATAYIAVSRTEASEVAVEELAPVALRYMRKGDVVIADEKFRAFVVLSPVGVAKVSIRV